MVLFFLLLTACTVPIEKFDSLTPAQARAYGVDVPDGTQKTGTIVLSRFGTFATMEKQCTGGVDQNTMAACP